MRKAERASNSHRHYDANGNLSSVTLTAGGAVSRSVCWQSSNHPTLIVAGSIDCAAPDLAGKVHAAFSYAPDRSRYKQVAGTGSTVTTTVYAGGLFERETLPSGTVRNIHYIRGPGRVVAEFTRTVDGQGATSDLTEYWHRDHLGSVVLRTDGSGNATAPCEYDAWGLKLACSGAKRGYTGHEHLGSLGLIHMNGRVYDPELGRFLSPDPFVQFPESTQGYNRYAYVGNNPLSRSDPSGHFEVAPQQVAGLIVAALPIPGASQWGWQMLAQSFASGYIGSGGEFRSGMFSSVSAFTAYGIGHKLFNDPKAFSKAWYGKVAVQSIAQGGISAAGGGRFGDGALGSLGSQVTAPWIESIDNHFVEAIVAASVGGTISDLTGGSFYNGALSAAFTYAFNEVGMSYATDPSTGQPTVKPTMMVSLTENEAQLAEDILVGILPGGALAACLANGCTVPAAAFAGIDVLPGGKLGKLMKLRGLGNPFKGKTLAQIDEMFRKKGFETRGDPLSGKGGYVNPETGRSYHIDPEVRHYKKGTELPHVDVNRPKDYGGALEKKKYPLGDKVYE